MLAVNGTDIDTFVPDELATVPEPPIPGIGICLGDICAETGEDGSFTLQPEKSQDTYYLKFSDPHADDPARAFRYINKWNGPVVIESYEVDGVTVPEQHLNDTNAIVLNLGLSIDKDNKKTIGFMQGFLTLPYTDAKSRDWWISNYFDLDINEGSIRTFNGDRSMMERRSPNRYGTDITGSGDQHFGVDFEGPRGDYVTSASNGNVFYLGLEQVAIEEFDFQFETACGHLDAILINMHDPIIRGQIIGLNGVVDQYRPEIPTHPHIHFGFYDISKEKSKGVIVNLDPYRDLIVKEYSIIKGENRYGESMIAVGDSGFWTVDNIPQFPLVTIIE